MVHAVTLCPFDLKNARLQDDPTAYADGAQRSCSRNMQSRQGQDILRSATMIVRELTGSRGDIWCNDLRERVRRACPAR
jgi:hypothetical protein